MEDIDVLITMTMGGQLTKPMKQRCQQFRETGLFKPLLDEIRALIIRDGAMDYFIKHNTVTIELFFNPTLDFLRQIIIDDMQSLLELYVERGMIPDEYIDDLESHASMLQRGMCFRILRNMIYA